MRRTPAKVIVLAVVIFFVLWLRRPDSLLNAQFWAEDGSIFFRERVLIGFWGTIFRTYAGYSHLIPRLIAEVACLFPVRWRPLAFSLSALVIQSIACSAFFWPCYRKIISSDSLRAVCCLAMAATIAGGQELMATVCNLQWYLAILSLLLLVAAGKEIWLTIIQVCIALTAPVTLLFTPMLLWQLKNNTGRLKVRPGLHLVALFIQATIMRQAAMEPKPPLHFNSLFVATLSGGLSRCVLSPLIGSGFLTEGWDVALVARLSLALLGGAVLVTLLAVRSYGSPQMKWLLSALYVAIGSLLAALWGRGLEPNFLTMDGVRHSQGERYFFVAACVFIFCLALGLEILIRWPKPGVSAFAMAAILALGTSRNFAVKPFVDLEWKKNAARIEEWEARKAAPLVVPINPNMTLTLDSTPGAF